MASSRSSEGVCEVAVFLDSIIRSTRPCIRKELISIALSLALSSGATVFLSKSNWAFPSITARALLISTTCMISIDSSSDSRLCFIFSCFGWGERGVVACLARILRLDTSQDKLPLYMLSNAVSRKNKILDMTLSTNSKVL